MLEKRNEMLQVFYDLSVEITKPEVLNNRKKLLRYDRFHAGLHAASESTARHWGKWPDNPAAL